MHQRLTYMYTLTTYLSISIIGDNYEPDRILESMNLDEYEIIGLPIEQLDDLSHKPTGIGMPHTLGTRSTSGLAPPRREFNDTVFGS